MRVQTAALALVFVLPFSLAAQLSDSELTGRMQAADADPTAENLLTATNAALNLRDYDAAEAYLEQAWDEAGPIFNGLVNLSIAHALASGGGMVGAQRAFNEASNAFNLAPVNIAAIESGKRMKCIFRCVKTKAAPKIVKMNRISR